LLLRQEGSGGKLVGDAETGLNGTNSTKCPTGTAATLVLDGVNNRNAKRVIGSTPVE